MRFFQEHHLRTTLERMKRHDPENAQAIQTVLDSPAGMEHLSTQLSINLDTPFSGHPILEWLWEHKAQILQFILTIVAMLASGS